MPGMGAKAASPQPITGIGARDRPIDNRPQVDNLPHKNLGGLPASASPGASPTGNRAAAHFVPFHIAPNGIIRCSCAAWALIHEFKSEFRRVPRPSVAADPVRGQRLFRADLRNRLVSTAAVGD